MYLLSGGNKFTIKETIGSRKLFMVDDDAEFLAEMRGEFLENVPTELEDCEGCLMRYEKSESDAELAEFKRLIHSIKGGARMVAVNELSTHLHVLETKLQKCIQENRTRDFVVFCLPFLGVLKSYVITMRDDGAVAPASEQVTQRLNSFS